MNFTQDATIKEISPRQFEVRFKGKVYGPTDNLTAIGTLLFGLRPRGIDYDFLHQASATMWLIQHAAYILHLHANGARLMHDGLCRVTAEDLERWIADAAALAPNGSIAAEARRLIIENLGPDPFGAGH